MCGIAGLIDQSGWLSPEAMRDIATRMAHAMTHRGPDDFGVWIDPTGYCALSHRRLSIIDTSSAGHQPMHSTDGRACITFGGELYNFQELRAELESQGHRFRTRTDTEVLMDVVRTYGAGAFAKMDGMYSFGLFLEDQRKLILARDPFGEKPLYYTSANGCFAFASEGHALAALPGFDTTIDEEALAQYLLLQYVPAPRSIYRAVKKLCPGEWLVLPHDDLPVIRRHFEFRPMGDPGQPRPLDDLADELEAILVRSIRRRVVSDVPLGAFLSGGVDSSLVVAIMSKVLGGGVKTFSIGFGRGAESEHAFGRRVAEHLGTDHHEKILKPNVVRLASVIGHALDEPNADTSCLPTYLLSQFARRKVTVALSGDGGDELFGGYEHYFSTLETAGRYESGDPNLKYWSPGEEHVRAMLVFSENEVRKLLGRMPPETSDWILSLKVRLNEDGMPLLSRLRMVDVATYMPGSILAKVDRMSMQHSLEVRSPLLSIEVAQFAERLHPATCYQGGQGKLVLKQLGARYMPLEWLTRRKTGFGLPMFSWAKKKLLRLARGMLLDSGSTVQRLIGAGHMKRLLAEQERGDASVRQLWSLLILETWLRSHPMKVEIGIGA